MISGTKSKWILLGFVAVYAIRLALTQTMGLMPQDAYYYFYSENLALSYFDHPPMVAYMLYAFSFLFGKSVAAIKLTDFIITMGSLISFYYLSTCFLSKRQALRTSLFFGSTLIISILSINTTPDVPLVFFWTLTLLAFYNAIFKQKTDYWLLTGLLIGLSFDSKYTALFLLFGVLFFLVLSTRYRSLLFSKSLLGLLLLALLASMPVLIWNAQNEWVSLLFQSSRRASSMGLTLRPELFLGNLGTQLLILLPPLFLGVLTVFYGLARKMISNWQLPPDKQLFLLAFSLPLLGFFLMVSLFYWVKLNWMIPGYITAIILAGRYLSNRVLTYQVGIAFVLHLLIFIQIVYYPIPIKSDDTWFGWDKLAQQAEQLQLDYPDHFLFSDDAYKTTAVLNFYLEKPVFGGDIIGKPGFQYAIIYPELSFLNGQNALYLDSDKKMRSRDKFHFIPSALEKHFETVIQLEPIIISTTSGKMKRKFWVYDCRNYKYK